MASHPDRGVAVSAAGDGRSITVSCAPATRDFTQFVWFWSFWAWSCESYRAGALLREPLQGMGGNWNAWFRHEASVEELRGIQLVTGSDSAQREFVEWLFSRWSRELEPTGNRSLARFAATQLSRAPPFRHWPVFEAFKPDYAAFGVSAIVLSQGSSGQADDVRSLEALALPNLERGAGAKICTEDFRADDTDLALARGAAEGLFRRRSALLLFATWTAGGRRPYGRSLRIGLAVGWLILANLLVFLRFGPDPGDGLRGIVAMVVVLWCGLSMTALTMLGWEAFRFAKEAGQWESRLTQSHLWFRMTGGLTVKGGSAGLAFCLNAVLAVHRAFVHVSQRSWIWKTIFNGLSARSPSCAATGVVTGNGKVEPVVIEPKLRACMQRPEIRHILTPRQSDARVKTIEQLGSATQRAPALPAPRLGMRLGYATGCTPVRLHRCSRVETAFFVMSGLGSRWQLTLNVMAIVVSVVVLAAARDFRCILIPPPAPVPVAGSLAGTDTLHVSLATAHAEYFRAALESDVWINRRIALSAARGVPATARLQVSLVRTAGQSAAKTEDGTVWIERRFLYWDREFGMSEKVGRYSVSYLSRLGPP